MVDKLIFEPKILSEIDKNFFNSYSRAQKTKLILTPTKISETKMNSRVPYDSLGVNGIKCVGGHVILPKECAGVTFNFLLESFHLIWNPNSGYSQRYSKSLTPTLSAWICEFRLL